MQTHVHMPILIHTYIIYKMSGRSISGWQTQGKGDCLHTPKKRDEFSKLVLKIDLIHL